MNYPTSTNFRAPFADEPSVQVPSAQPSMQPMQSVIEATEVSILECRVDHFPVVFVPKSVKRVPEGDDGATHLLQAHGDTFDKCVAGSKKSVDEALIAGAIAGVIRAAQRKGQTIEELQAEMLADHQLLDWNERCLLNEIVTEAWQRMAIAPLDIV